MPNTEPIAVPFTILIDSNEGQPFSFDGLKADSDKNYRPLVVPTRHCSLGRYPHGLGDYSINGMSDRVAVERKSCDDIWGTVMGWDQDGRGAGRRERFKSELTNLAKIEAAIVIVEAPLGILLEDVPEWGDRPAEHNRKIFNRTMLGMLQDFGVPWLFCDSRRHAEVETFLYLQRFFKKN